MSTRFSSAIVHAIGHEHLGVEAEVVADYLAAPQRRQRRTAKGYSSQVNDEHYGFAIDLGRDLKKPDLGPERIESRRSIHLGLQLGASTVFRYGYGPGFRKILR